MQHLKVSIPGLGCRRCLREVTARLRDVPGVETVVADPTANAVVVSGTMAGADLLRAIDDSEYTPHVIRHVASPAE